MELATTPRNQELVSLWLKHNACLDSRPTVYIEWGTFEQEVIPPLLRCENEEARQLEYALYANFIGQELFGDDSVVPDYMPVGVNTHFVPFGIEVKVDHAAGGGLGHHFHEVLHDLGEDFHKLGKSTYGADMQKSQAQLERCNLLFGDILPAKLTGACLYAVPTQCIVHIMSMENMLFAMYDYPELFHKMMDMLTNDYIEYFRFRETRGLILPTTRNEWVGNGSFAFTDELPGPEIAARRQLTSHDVWGFLDSQDTTRASHPTCTPNSCSPTTSASPSSTACCRTAAAKPSTRSGTSACTPCPTCARCRYRPGATRETMGERLRGTNIVYHRKPSPNMLGTGTVLDEDAVRASTGAPRRGPRLHNRVRSARRLHRKPRHAQGAPLRRTHTPVLRRGITPPRRPPFTLPRPEIGPGHVAGRACASARPKPAGQRLTRRLRCCTLLTIRKQGGRANAVYAGHEHTGDTVRRRAHAPYRYSHHDGPRSGREQDSIKRLEREKIILKYPALINWDKTTTERVEAIIEVRVTPQRDQGFDAIAARIYRYEEVRSVYLMSGGYDLCVMAEARTMRQLAFFVAEKLSTLDSVISTATHFMLKKYKEDGVIFEGADAGDHRLAVSP